MKTISIAFITLIISSLLTFKPAIACWWGPMPEDLRVYLFNPNLAGHKDLSPFYFNTQQWNSYDIFDWNNIPEENIEEWTAYFGNSVSREAIKDLIYRSTTNEILKLKNGEKSKNALAQYLSNNKRSDIIEYLYFAKQIEDLFRPIDEWTPTTPERKTLEKFALIAEKEIGKAKDMMMKQRYAYQSVMLYRYANNYSKAIDLYNKTWEKIKLEDVSVMKYWALSHVAYSQADTDKKESQKNYLRTFANCHAKKFWASHELDKEYVKKLKEDLTDCDLEYANLYLAYNNPGKAIEELESLAESNFNSAQFKSLIVREINKIELWIKTPEYTGSNALLYWESNEEIAETNRKNDIAYAAKVAQLVEQIAHAEGNEDIGFYQLAAAHLYFTAGDANKAMSLLNTAEKNIKTDEQKIQLRYTRIVIRAISTPKLDADFENQIWADMKEIVKDTTGLKHNREFANLMLALHHAYHNKNMFDRAALFVSFDLNKGERWETRWWDYTSEFYYLDKYANRFQVENFTNTVVSDKKTDLEKFLLKKKNIDTFRYFDLMGTMELRKGNYEKAIEYYHKIPEKFWASDVYSYKTYLSENPFWNTNVHFRQESVSQDAHYFNKEVLVKKLLEHINKYENETAPAKKAELAFQIGNVYYNMSYFGTHWHTTSYGWSIYGTEIIYTSHNTEINENYKTCSLALKYYEEAVRLHPDKNRQAEFLFASAGIKYETDTYFERINYWDESKPRKPVPTNKFAIELRNNYPDDYKEFASECAYVKNFIE